MLSHACVCAFKTYRVACITDVPRPMEAVSGVDVGEGLLEERVAGVGDAVVVEVVAGGDDEVDVQLLPDHAHLRTYRRKTKVTGSILLPRYPKTINLYPRRLEYGYAFKFVGSSSGSVSSS
jgi:hypothetical protein